MSMSVKGGEGVKKLSLEAEIRDGYYVSKKMKQIWQVQLDLLEKFIDICNKYNLDYSLYAGTAIGAVRHKGYIPWDDDIDIVMMRDQYNIFLKYAKEELEDPYFVQNEESEPDFYRQYTQLRRSDTTAIIDIDLEYNYNCGISIDIFVMDKVPNDLKKRRKFIKKIDLMRRLFLFHNGNKIKKVAQFVIRPRFVIKRCAKYIQKYKDDPNAERCGIIGFRPHDKYRKTAWFKKGNFKEVPFEYLTAKITKDYDEYLTFAYGDYMTPPKEKGNGAGSDRGKTFFDTKRSYLYYQDRKEEVRKKLS